MDYAQHGFGLGEDDVEMPWFALHVKSNCEKPASSILRNKGYDSYVPMCVGRSASRRSATDGARPLIPGYVFCRLDPRQRLPILTTPGVVRIVSFGATPAPIPVKEIAALQALVASGPNPMPWEYLSNGQRIRIEHGPLAGLEGTIVESKGTHRIVVSVTLLQRSVAAEVERSWLSGAAI